MKLKELCELTNIKYDKSHADRSLKEVKRKYLIGQNGNKKDYYIIRELSDDEKYSVKKLTNCKKILKDTICVMLTCVDENKVRADTKGLLEIFNIVNNKYKYFSYEEMNDTKYEILKNYVEPNEKGLDLYYFVNDIHPLLSRMLKETLNNLVDEKLIYKREFLMFGYYKKFSVGNNNENIVESRYSVEATDEQIEEFMSWSKHFMDEYGYKKWSDVPYFIKGKINKEICKKMKISYVYDEYELILNKEYLDKIVQNDRDLVKLKNEVSEKIFRSKQGELKNRTLENKKENVKLLIE